MGVIGFIVCFNIFLSCLSGNAIELKRIPMTVTPKDQKLQTVPDILSITLPNTPPAPSVSLTQGQVYTLILTTKNVDKTMVLSFGEGIPLSNTQYINDTSIRVGVNVAPIALIGKHDIKITYGNQSRTATAFVSVVAASKPITSQAPFQPATKPLDQTIGSVTTFKPVVLNINPFTMTGLRGSGSVAEFKPVTIILSPFVMTGVRP